MRIIAGKHRGRKLLAPDGQRTRPITDRVKESLFNILLPWTDGAYVADLFCGTGSFGLEAISRGAAHCWLADMDASAVSLLKQNIEMVDESDRATVWQGDIERMLPAWMGELAEPLDIVSLDPPYPLARKWMKAGRIDLLEPLAEVLASDGVIVLRTPRDLELPAIESPVSLSRRKEYGSMALSFFMKP